MGWGGGWNGWGVGKRTTDGMLNEILKKIKKRNGVFEKWICHEVRIHGLNVFRKTWQSNNPVCHRAFHEMQHGHHQALSCGCLGLALLPPLDTKFYHLWDTQSNIFYWNYRIWRRQDPCVIFHPEVKLFCKREIILKVEFPSEMQWLFFVWGHTDGCSTRC